MLQVRRSNINHCTGVSFPPGRNLPSDLFSTRDAFTHSALTSIVDGQVDCNAEAPHRFPSAPSPDRQLPAAPVALAAPVAVQVEAGYAAVGPPGLRDGPLLGP